MCRVNDLMQIYDKNPKSEPNIQSLTKNKIPHNYLSYTGFLFLFIVCLSNLLHLLKIGILDIVRSWTALSILS